MSTTTAFTKLSFIGCAFVFLMGVLLPACDESSYDVEILTYDARSDRMVYRVAKLETLNDLGKLEGRATRIRGGISIDLDYYSREVRWNRLDTPVSFGSVRVNGVHYPTDFDSLAMASVYYSIEQSMLFFEEIGLAPGGLGELDTYYQAEVYEIYDIYSDSDVASVDNAFFLPISKEDRGFYILPFEVDGGLVSGVPLSLNPGVLTHEYSHAVFQHLVYDQLPFDGIYIENLHYNYLLSLNEGIADIFAVARTGDPDFIRPSIADLMVTRNAAAQIIYTPDFDLNVEEPGADFWDPYEIGAFYSAAIYEMARRFQGLPANGVDIPSKPFRYLAAKTTFMALDALGTNGADYFLPADFFSEFLVFLGPAQKAIACGVLSERFVLHYSEVEGCP